MGNVSYTLDNYLLPGVVRNSHLPVANVTFQAADIGVICDDEISTGILETILSTREGFYLRSVDITPDSNGVVQIPYRTIGGRVHDVQMVSGSMYIPMTRIEPSDLTNSISPPANGYAFYFRGNEIVTVPPSTSPLRIWHYPRPSSITPEANCAQVTAIGATTVTVSATPSTFTASALLDFVQDQPPFGLLSYDKTLVSAIGNVLTFTSGDIPSALAVGDWVCPAGLSPVAQIPLEFQPLLKQRATCRVLEFQGHMQRLEAAQAKLAEMEKKTLGIINPRAEENPKKITPSRSLVSPGIGRNNWIVGR